MSFSNWFTLLPEGRNPDHQGKGKILTLTCGLGGGGRFLDSWEYVSFSNRLTILSHGGVAGTQNYLGRGEVLTFTHGN